jgi:hypothetical protein
MSNTSNNGSGNGPSKKDNSLAATIGANAGDFALNFLDKLKKKNSTTNLMQNANNNSPPNSQHQTDSNSSITNAISNLAISFHKNLTNNKNESKQLMIIDDDNYDDNDFGIETSTLLNNSDSNSSKAKIPVSQSVYDITNKPTKLGDLKTSATTFDINKIDTNSISGESHASIVTTSSSSLTNSAANTPSSSTSFQKISSVWDDLLKKRSDLADEAAESLKKKLFNKVSLDNIKNKRASQSSNHSSAVTTPININNKSLNQFESDISITNPTFIKEENNSNTTNISIDSNNNSANSTKDNDLSVAITSNNNDNENKIKTVDNDDKMNVNESTNTKDNIIDSTVENKNRNDDNNKNKNTNNPVIKYYLPILLSILVPFFYILPKNFSYFLLTYTFGLINGALIAICIFYLVIKLDFLKYILKDKKVSSAIGSSPYNLNDSDLELDTKYNDKCTEYKLRNLLIQSCLTKENRNFDGIYRVSFCIILAN